MDINTKAFKKELEWVNRFIEGRTTIPILSTVALVAENGALVLMGTDLEVGGISRLEVASNSDWGLTVPSKLLLKYLKCVTQDTITLTPHIEKTVTPASEKHCNHCDGTGKCQPGGRAEVACPECKGEKVIKIEESISYNCRLQVNHGDEGEIYLDGMSIESFPVMPLAPLTTYIQGMDVAVPRAVVSISHEETRFTLNGALLQVKGGVANLISTDGHRLGIVDIKVATTLPEIKTLIMARALTEANNMDGGKCYFGMDENFQVFTNGRRTVVARKLTGNFPDHERVMPKDVQHIIEFNPAAFNKVLDRVALFADERSRAIRLHVEAGKLEANAESCDVGKAKGAVPAEGVNGTKWEGGFNATYLQDFLGHNKGVSKVSLEFKDTEDQKHPSAAMLVTDGWRYVVMPMRI